jgi:FtsZ-interacting cell division protein ZipA
MRNKFIRFGKALRYELVKRLPWIIVLLVLISGWAAWQSYSKTAEGVEIAKANTTDIKNILASQTDLLNAIRQVTIDNNLTAKQQTDIIICMLQVPVEKRTTDLKENCRNEVEVSQATTEDNPANDGIDGSQSESSRGSSPNNTQRPPNVQPENPQTPNEPERNLVERGVRGIMNVINRIF